MRNYYSGYPEAWEECECENCQKDRGDCSYYGYEVASGLADVRYEAARDDSITDAVEETYFDKLERLADEGER